MTNVTDEQPAAPLRDDVGHGHAALEGPASGRRLNVRWRRVLGVAAMVVAAYYTVNLVQVVQTARGNDVQPSDAILVLGAAQYDGTPSPQLAARLDHALGLYDSGFAPFVMVTGGKQPGDRFTEAEASRQFLLDNGVPAEAILLENDGRSTYESLESAANLLASRGLDEVVVVTDPYHSYRSELIAESFGLDAHSSPTPTSVVRGWGSARRQVVEAGGVAVGRLIGFDRVSGLGG